MPEAQIRRLIRRRQLLPVGWGVYAPAPVVAAAGQTQAAMHALRLAAALARTGPEVVGSHHSAAIVHGLELLGRDLGQVVEVTRPPGAPGSRTRAPGVRVHEAALPDRHITVRSGVPVTSVARTVADIARLSSFPAGVVAADAALRARSTSKAELRAVLRSCAHWPGVRQARRVAEFSDARSESVFESVARVAFDAEGLPAPELQAWVGDDEGVIGRADFLWREHRTIGEADGAVKYADPARAIAQLDRDARLRGAGYEVVHFRWNEICAHPGSVADAIRGAFRRAARLSA